VNQTENSKINRVENRIAYLVLGVILAGLIFYAYLGVHNRYWADDWCYNADFYDLGVVETIKGYSTITTYASNRFSLTLFSGLLYSLGIFGVQIMSPLNLAVWFFGVYWVLDRAKTIFDLPLSRPGIFSIALVSVYYSLYTAPHLFQSVYWRSGVMPYGEPIVIGVLLFGLILHQAALTKRSIPLIVISMILAFITGGFSEAASAALLTSILIYIGLAIVFRKQPWAQRTLPVVIGVLAAALLSMAVLIIAPTNAQRLDKYGEQAFSLDFAYKTIKFSLDFIKFSFLDTPVPHIVLVATSGLLGYVFSKDGTRTPSIKKIIAATLIGIVLAYLLIAASYAPSAFIEKTPPAPRTRIIPRFILTLMLVIISFSAGFLARQKIQVRWMPALVSVSLVLAVLYSSYSVKNIYALDEIYSQRAELWDARAAEIERAAQQGEGSIVVYGIDGAPVGGIRDFVSGGVGVWINHCAADYYGLEQIIVDP